MEINATIIVQAIHFSLAYLILKKLFFTPAVRIVLHERAVEQQILDRTAASRVQILNLQKQTASEWAAHQHAFVALIPPVTKQRIYTGVPSKPAIQMPEIDPAQERRLEHELAHTIIGMVNHVH